MISKKTSEYAQRINSGETVGISFHYYNRQKSGFVSSLVKKVLERENKVFLQDTLVTVLRELIFNAVKANSKRYYFLSQGIDMSRTEQYRRGMESFKKFLVSTGESITDNLREHDLRVELFFRKQEDGLRILVRNNTPILPDEMNRIRDRMERASRVNDFAEVYEELNDASEGEGLGLLLTMLFLRNSGIGEQSLRIGSDGKNTHTALMVPHALKPHAITTLIQNRILAEVESLPVLPEHITDIQKLCANPDASLKEIAGRVVFDPALSALVLKMANSAAFVTRKKAETVQDALSIIGIRNLQALLYAAGAQSVMEKKFKTFRTIWDHSARVALYARVIALRTGMPAIADTVFLAGLLHDLGKIILLSTSPALNEWIADLTVNRAVRTSTVIEEIAIGMSHATIGGMVAEKWNLPRAVTALVRHHHSPSSLPADLRKIGGIVYLANELCMIEAHKIEYHAIESDVVEDLGFADLEAVKVLHEALRKI